MARILLLALMNAALKPDGVRDGLAHGELQVRWPCVETGAVQEDRPRNVEVAGECMKAVEFVHAVGDGIRQRILLSIDGALADRGNRLGEVEPHRHRAE